jgi:hypothetical protein
MSKEIETKLPVDAATNCSRLRAIFPNILHALGNGACCSRDSSVELFELIPSEVEKYRKKIERERDRAERETNMAIAQRNAARAQAEYWRDIATGAFAKSATLPWEVSSANAEPIRSDGSATSPEGKPS